MRALLLPATLLWPGRADAVAGRLWCQPEPCTQGVDELLAKWDRASLRLQNAELRFEASGCKQRPLVRIGTCCCCFGGEHSSAPPLRAGRIQYLASFASWWHHWCQCCSDAWHWPWVAGAGPHLGCSRMYLAAGEQVHAIDHWAGEVRRLEQEIVAGRQAALDAPASGSFIVLFHTQKDAAIAAQTRLHSDDGHAFRVSECPGPEEVGPSAHAVATCHVGAYCS